MAALAILLYTTSGQKSVWSPEVSATRCSLDPTATGTVFLDGYEAIETTELQQGAQFSVDTDHLVAVDASAEYSTVRPGGGGGGDDAGAGVSDYI